MPEKDPFADYYSDNPIIDRYINWVNSLPRERQHGARNLWRIFLLQYPDDGSEQLAKYIRDEMAKGREEIADLVQMGEMEKARELGMLVNDLMNRHASMYEEVQTPFGIKYRRKISG